MTTPKIRGKSGEDALHNWLSGSNLSYVSICQSQETFAKLFADSVKRPDFLLLLHSIGLIAIDAKNCTYSSEYQNYTLNYDTELRRSLMFENLFRIPLWYAFYDKSAESEKWYWISSLKALEMGEIKQKNDGSENFLAIKREHFIVIETVDDLAKLYSHRIDDIKSLAKALLPSSQTLLRTKKGKSTKAYKKAPEAGL